MLVEGLDLVDGGLAPEPSRATSDVRVSSVQGSPGGGMRSASRWSEPLAIGRSSSAAVAARRRGSEASLETGASGVSAISPSTWIMSGPRSAASVGVCRVRRGHAGSAAVAAGSDPRAGAGAKRRR